MIEVLVEILSKVADAAGMLWLSLASHERYVLLLVVWVGVLVLDQFCRLAYGRRRQLLFVVPAPDQAGDAASAAQ